MKIKIFKLIDTLNNISKNYHALNQLKGPKFLYAILHNVKVLENVLGNLNEIIKPSNDYTEYQQKRIEICNKYALKDEYGKPVMVNNNNVEEFKINEDYNDEFTKQIKKLQEKYKSAIDKYLTQVDKYNEELEKEIDIDFTLLNVEDIPEDINFELMSAISLFINK